MKQQGTHQDEVNYVEWFTGTTHRVYGRDTPGYIKYFRYVLTNNYFLILLVLFNATVSAEDIILKK